MKPKDKIEICEKMSDNKKKIDDLNSKLKDDSLTTQGYYYILDMRTQLKRENESYLSVLEAGLNTDEFGSVYERTPTKKPFIKIRKLKERVCLLYDNKIGWDKGDWFNILWFGVPLALLFVVGK
jgi:hypothetical protein